MSFEQQIRVQVEFMVSKFQSLVARCDAIDSSFKSLSDSVQTISGTQADHSKAIDEDGEKIDLFMKRCEKIEDSVKGLADLWQSKFERMDSLVADLMQQIKDMNGQLINLKSDHGQSEKMSAKIADSHDAQLKLLGSSVQSLAELGMRIESLEKFQDKTASALNSINDSFALSTQGAQSIAESVKLIHAKVESDNQAREDRVNLALAALKESADRLDRIVTERISSIKIPSLDGLSTAADLKALTNQLESIRLDARNGYQKATNADTQIQIINKRLESLQLQLKSYDLAKG